VSRSITRSWQRRYLAIAPIAALVAAGLTTGSTSGVASASPAADRGPATGSSSDDYMNYVAPQVEAAVPGDDNVKGAKKRSRAVLERAEEIDRKFASGNPKAARQLAKLERKAIKKGTSPKRIKQANSTQEARLLTILLEFGGPDDFSGFERPATVFGDRSCVTEPEGTMISGPLHNNIPNPADWKKTVGAEDNQSFWVEDFSSEHFNKMLYTDRGITERVRPDLKGPDGRRGIDISGYTMKRMYEEMSKGAYTVSGEATPWITVPHSEAWYGASRCLPEDSDFPQSMHGHPDNPRGAGQLAIDAVDALAASDPSFPWEDYDIEDQGDVDGDGDFLEPDGVVDHLVLVHAGEDKSGGGGAEGTYAIWAHSSAIGSGYPVPGTDVKVSNYIVQPEDSGVGVFAHEYGHDLGLPDLYDTSGAGDSDIDFWDLLSSGSHSGPIFQSMPTHMGLWDKWVLGWADPLTIEPGSRSQKVKIGQTSRTPEKTEDGVRVILPPKEITLATPHSGENMWWSNNDQDWADVTINRDVAVPAGSTDARFWMWNNYVIEDLWDYGFVEVSADGGSTWEELVVTDEAGTEVSTNRDDNGRLVDYGNKKNGLTGDTHGWRHDYVDLTPYAGKTVQVRLRYATDAGFLERGWFADDFSLTDGGTTVWSDDVEGGANGWTAQGGTFTTTSGEGWKIDTGSSSKSQYYLVEWRNFDGFDEGLKYAYDTTYSSNGPWKVEKIAYNAPGMLVWYRDTTYGNTNHVTATTFDLPSTGSKGGLLLVDSHFDPLRRQGEAAVKDPSTLNNMPSRPQSSNVAFTTHSTYPFKECLAEVDANPFTEYCTSVRSQRGVSDFTDAKGWYPGIEVRDEGLFFRDIDASAVIPSAGNQPYSTRVVDAEGNPLTDWYGEDLGAGIVLGSGNPGDEGVDMGVRIRLEKAGKNNFYAKVRIDPADL
jgi:immune inhibitor A